MRFQERDGQILQTIHALDGVVAKRQLKKLFWPDTTWRAMEKRLSLLYHNAYLDWPALHHWREQPIPEAICWLGWKGALWLAGQEGHAVKDLGDSPGETQLRKLQANLRKLGLRWAREPRWSMLAHDLTVNDFRLSLTRAIENLPNLRLERWISESVFRAEPDVVSFATVGRGGHTYFRKKGVVPDGYAQILDVSRVGQGLLPRARFLLEMDNGTHDLGSFRREKILPGIAYLQDSTFQQRFGAMSGRWLVVTRGGRRRLEHLRQQAIQNGGEDEFFLFTTWRDVEQRNALSAAIWYQASDRTPRALFPGERQSPE